MIANRQAALIWLYKAWEEHGIWGAVFMLVPLLIVFVNDEYKPLVAILTIPLSLYALVRMFIEGLTL